MTPALLLKLKWMTQAAQRKAKNVSGNALIKVIIDREKFLGYY
jgi:hypothetical protein